MSDNAKVEKDLRSCLLGVKDPLPISNVNRDYRELIGEPIPFRKLGFPSLEEFFSSIPHVVHLTRTREGHTLVQAVADECTQHVADLVANQNTAKSSRRRPRLNGRGRSGYRTGVYRDSTRGSYYMHPPRRPTPPTRITPPPPNRNTFNKSAHSSTSKPTIQYNSNNVSYVQPPRFQRLKQARTTAKPPKEPLANSRSDTRTDYSVGHADRCESPTFPQGAIQINSPVLRRPQRERNTSPTFPAGSIRESSSPTFPEGALQDDNSFDTARPPVFTRTRVFQEALSGASYGLSTNSSVLPSMSLPTAPKPRKPVRKPDPTTSFRPVSTDNANTNKGKLDALIEYLGWEPAEYKSLRTKEPMATVMVHGKRYSSYPDPCSNKEHAEQTAAGKALEDLETLHDKERKYSVQTDDGYATERLVEILRPHSNAIWTDTILTEYEEKYQETLPADWVERILKSNIHLFKVDELMAVDKVTVRLKSRSSEENSSPESMNSNSRSNSISTSRPDSVNSTPNSVNSRPESASLPLDSMDFVLPEGDSMAVLISAVVSGWEICINLVNDVHDKYMDMLTDMEMWYMDMKPKGCCETVEIGCLYAGVDHTEVFRVLVESVSLDGSFECYLVDDGIRESFTKENLFVLEPKFMVLPYQAATLHLWCLETLADCYATKAVLTEYDTQKKPLVAKIVSREGIPSVILFDTTTEKDLNINEDILLKFIKRQPVFQLPPAGDIINIGHVTHVTNLGLIHITMDSETMELLSSVLEQTMFIVDQVEHINKVEMGMMYVVRSNDGWSRAVTMVPEPDIDGNIEVLFVDFGMKEVVNLSHMRFLEDLHCHFLEAIVPQAIPCKLNGVTSMDVSRFWELIESGKEGNDEEPILIKILTNEGLTEINLYVRKGKSQELLNINDALTVPTLDVFLSRQLSLPLTSDAGDTNDNTPLERRRSNPTTFNSTFTNPPKILHDERSVLHLPVPKLPEITEYFDIVVTIAANPSNFLVQARITMPQFTGLMTQMQMYYSNPINRLNLDCYQVVPAYHYVALHADNYWYRVKVSTVMSNELPPTAIVYYVDFGDCASVSIDKLQFLLPDFCHLPVQAIRAKVAGICAKNQDWDVTDCLYFQTLVRNKEFVSIVQSKETDSDNGDTVLGLKIFDTKDETKDVDIGELFISEGRAVAAKY